MEKNNIPYEMRSFQQWVCWKNVSREGKMQKIPINPNSGKPASVSDEHTWSDFSTAMRACEERSYDGIGFVVTKECGIVCVDINHCYDPAKGEYNAVARDILAMQNTYAEISPSGTGCHLFYIGDKPDGVCKNPSTGVEMYDHSRFITITANLVGSAYKDIECGTTTLEVIHKRYLSDDKEAKCNSGDSEDRFADLMAGQWQNYYKSQSEADLALCRLLAKRCENDTEAIDKAFRESKLFRLKWDKVTKSNGNTYGQNTIAKAIASVQQGTRRGRVFERERKLFREKGETSYQITNFKVIPVQLIIAPEESMLVMDLVSEAGATKRMTFATSDFSSLAKFKAILNRNTISYSYFGTDGDLELLKNYLSTLEWTELYGVKPLGIHSFDDELVFVDTNGATCASGETCDGIVQVAKYAGIHTDILQYSPIPAENLAPLANALLRFNEPLKTVSIVSWAAACFVKELLRMAGIKFPHLFLVGEAGSGKSTTLERVLLPIFSATRVIAASQTTSFTVLHESASSNLIPFVIDEFKPSKLDEYKMRNLLNCFRDSYDGHEGLRGRSDQSVTAYEHRAPLLVAGEESPEETAIRERSIELLYTKRTINTGEYDNAFRYLTKNEVQLHEFGRTLLATSLTLSVEQCKDWHTEAIARFAKEFPPRVVNNLACCAVGLKVLETACITNGMSWESVFPWSIDVCEMHLQDAAKKYLLHDSYHNPSVVELTLEIFARMPDIGHLYYIDETGEKLFIRIGAIYDMYTKYRRDHAITGETLTHRQFCHQLRASDLFIEGDKQVFRNRVNAKYWVLDYAKMKTRCDVSGFEKSRESEY